jgi:hypothetical protein
VIKTATAITPISDFRSNSWNSRLRRVVDFDLSIRPRLPPFISDSLLGMVSVALQIAVPLVKRDNAIGIEIVQSSSGVGYIDRIGGRPLVFNDWKGRGDEWI